MDRHIPEQAFVMGSDVLNDLLPGVSSKAKLITFRTSDYFNMALFPVEEIEQRIADRKTLFSKTASPDVKMNLLRSMMSSLLLLRLQTVICLLI
ncbi:MAG: hypothetical protein QM730_06805 [Anaerolineales bacterium]